MKESDRGGAGGVQGFDPWFQRDGEAHGGGVQDSLRQSPTFTADRDDGAGNRWHTLSPPNFFSHKFR